MSNALEESINVVINNQEIGPNSENYFTLSRAKCITLYLFMV